MITAPSEKISLSQAAATRPFYWSLRREIWENRSLYIAPLIVAAVVVFGFIISAIGLPERRRAVLLLDPEKAHAAISAPYVMAAIMIMFTGFIVGVFYCLDALYGERRDRSVLFWKSLPVSDLTTVLAKVAVPLAILPAITFVVALVAQVVIMFWTSAVLLAHGMSPASTWANVNLLRDSVSLLYGVIAVALWHAPVYGWLLLVSSWVRRAALLWAVLPFIAVSMLERIVFNTSHFGSLIGHRLMGFSQLAFAFNLHAHRQSAATMDSLAELTPGKYLTTAGLWLGLIVATAFIAAAVRMRRDRGAL